VRRPNDQSHRARPDLSASQIPWRYAYRFSQKQKTLALGIYPDVSLERARSRHEFARNLLAHGLDPSALKAALGKHTFAATLREWEKARGDMSALPLRSHARNRADQIRPNSF
jgi:hypothetical protein